MSILRKKSMLKIKFGLKSDKNKVYFTWIPVYILDNVFLNFSANSVGSRFATIRFTTIQFYDTCRVGPSTPDLWPITVATRRPFSSQCAFRSFPVCMCFFFICFNAVLLSWMWFFHTWRPSKRQKKKSKQLTLHSLMKSSEPWPGPS